MSNGSDQRIRQVAIVLQSLDAATSRGLLAQLPAAQGKLVRQAMAKLGPITAQERAAAMQSMQGMLNPNRTKPVGNSTKSRAELSSSPASELLAASQSEGIDEIVLSTEAAHASEPTPIPTGHLPSWHHLPDDVLGEILQSERPMLIATVLNSLPIERVTAILQSLPIQLAGATLSAIPQVRLTDSAILKDIESEIERKVSKFQPQRQVSEEGLARLQAILAGLPSSQMNIWTNALNQSNPVLARKLGLAVTLPTESHTKDEIPKSPDAATQDHSTDVIDELASSDRSLPRALNSNDQSNVRSVGPYLADRPHLSVYPNEPHSETASENDLPADRSSESRTRTYQSPLSMLDSLSDRDFVTVLHTCDPHTVLLAISGANKTFVARVERLIPPRDIQRLRKKLIELETKSLKEIDTAQQLIANTADKLLATGKIGALQNVTFTAAA